MNIISSWSGGKDSCLACYRAIQQGYKIKYLVNFISRQYRRCCFHGVSADLLKLQTEAVGITLFQKEVSPDMQEYEKEFKEAVTELKGMGAEGMVFGDIYLDEHRDWVERVCGDLNIKPVEPLWKLPAEKIASDFIDAGFKSVIVSCKADILGEDFLGRVYNNELVAYLKERNICPCGENGEFHTLVTDGPMFKKKIKLTETKKILRKGFWEHWFLDIKKYELSEKQ
ncbi:diphthine--ammonia ligase [Elusimicrobiota bacterium]